MSDSYLTLETLRVKEYDYDSAAHSLPPQLKTYGFAIAIIVGIGGVAAAVFGLAGYLHVGALSHFNQTHAITLLAIGSETALFSFGVAGEISNHQEKQDADDPIFGHLINDYVIMALEVENNGTSITQEKENQRNANSVQSE